MLESALPARSSLLFANWRAGTGEWSGGAIFAKKLDGVASTVTIKGGAIGGANATAANKATGSAVYAGKGAAFMWARTAP